MIKVLEMAECYLYKLPNEVNLPHCYTVVATSDNSS